MKKLTALTDLTIEITPSENLKFKKGETFEVDNNSAHSLIEKGVAKIYTPEDNKKGYQNKMMTPKRKKRGYFTK